MGRHERPHAPASTTAKVGVGIRRSDTEGSAPRDCHTPHTQGAGQTLCSVVHFSPWGCDMENQPFVATAPTTPQDLALGGSVWIIDQDFRGQWLAAHRAVIETIRDCERHQFSSSMDSQFGHSRMGLPSASLVSRMLASSQIGHKI